MASINPDAVGYSLTIIAEVKVESERADHLDAMRRSFEACPRVQQPGREELAKRRTHPPCQSRERKPFRVRKGTSERNV